MKKNFNYRKRKAAETDGSKHAEFLFGWRHSSHFFASIGSFMNGASRNYVIKHSRGIEFPRKHHKTSAKKLIFDERRIFFERWK
jgi:hypothetical protein